MKKQILIRCFLTTLLSVLIVFAAGGGLTSISNRNLVRERLLDETAIVTGILNRSNDFNSLDAFGDLETCRVTIISPDGDVLYDSDVRGPFESHIDREEVVAALADTPITVERYSETFRCAMTYYACKTQLASGQEVILRLALRSAEINDYLLSAIPFLLLALLLSGLVAGLFARQLSHNVAKRVTDITASLKSVNGGSYVPLQADVRDSEFFAVYNEINDLNEKTVLHIQRIESDRERWNAVFDNISQGIIALDPYGNIAFVNHSALVLFGGDASAVSQKPAYLINDASLLTKITEVNPNEEARFEHRMGDATLFVEMIPPTGRILEHEIRHILILSDITAQKELAWQKEEFFANASHELKTPLTAMVGLSELALARETDETVHKQLERIHKESLRLSDLISDMLKLSRLESAKDAEAPATTSVEVSTIADEVLTELSEAMAQKGVSSILTGNVTVKADEKRVYEILQNLCSNAVNYNKEGGTVEVLMSETATHGVIRVKDSGIGIAEEHLPYLCQRFYRVDKSRSKKTGGTGLGLAIVKHICALYGADFRIESTLGEGTEVTVAFKK